MKLHILLTVLGTVTTSTSAQQCYSMDGQALDARYQPCYPNAGSTGSACCMLNGTQGANQQNDLCLDSGLCQSTSGWYAGFLYINGCTDQTGKADGCPKICNFKGNQYSWSVLQCQPGTFCCRAASDTANCCNDNSSIISTSHIGTLLLPGSTSPINTTYNSTTEAPAVVTSSAANTTCSSNSTSAFNSALCPVDHSATVGGAVGGVLGAALIGAFVALAFALRSRKHFKRDLVGAKGALVSTEIKAAEEKAGFEKQLEEQQRQMQTRPPNNPPNGVHAPSPMHGYNNGNVGAYSPAPHAAAPTEMPHEGYVLSELGGDNNSSRAELTGEGRKA